MTRNGNSCVCSELALLKLHAKLLHPRNNGSVWLFKITDQRWIKRAYAEELSPRSLRHVRIYWRKFYAAGERKKTSLFYLKLEIRCGEEKARGPDIKNSDEEKKMNWGKICCNGLPVIPRSRGRFNIDSENIRNLSVRTGRCRDRELEVRGVFI